MKIINLFFIILLSFILSGCVTALLVTGTVIGGVYVADEIENDYNGDAGEFIEDKTSKAYKAITKD